MQLDYQTPPPSMPLRRHALIWLAVVLGALVVGYFLFWNWMDSFYHGMGPTTMPTSRTAN